MPKILLYPFTRLGIEPTIPHGPLTVPRQLSQSTAAEQHSELRKISLNMARVSFQKWSNNYLLTLALCLIQSLVAGLAPAHYFESVTFTRRGLSVVEVQTELGALVSRNTTIFGPEDPRFVDATERWSNHAVPDIEVVVVPGTEHDVSVIV